MRKQEPKKSLCRSRVAFAIPAVPVAQPRPRTVVIHGRARTVSAFSQHPVHTFKAIAAHAAREAWDGAPIDGPVRLTAVFVLRRTSDLIWKKAPMPRRPHCKKPDLDNLIKSLKDAFHGIVWRDDSLVCECILKKCIAAGDEQPHVEVILEVI